MGACLIGLSLAGCAAPTYDAQTDKLISTLESDVDTELVSLIADDETISGAKIDPALYDQGDAAKSLASAAYRANIAFYSRLDVSLMAIKLRIDAETLGETRQKIDIAMQQLRDNLLKADGSLQKTHQMSNGLSRTYLIIFRQQITQQFQALLTYELVLKNGANGGESFSTSTASTEAK